MIQGISTFFTIIGCATLIVIVVTLVPVIGGFVFEHLQKKWVVKQQ